MKYIKLKKLLLEKLKHEAYEFMEEFPGRKIGGGEYSLEHGNVKLGLDIMSSQKIYLRNLHVDKKYRGIGLASKTVELLKKLADKHGVQIELDAGSDDDSGLTTDQLIKWYQRHGFKPEPFLDPGNLIYSPKTFIKENIDCPKIEMMSPEEFERNGGYNVGIGEQSKLYTLRSDSNEQGAFYVGDNQPPEIRHFRRSYYYQNLGKDWNEVVNRLPEILKKRGYNSNETVKIYVPGFVSGKLDPNNPPTDYVPSDKMEFGKYVGSSIDELKKTKEGLDYLLYLATNYKPNLQTNRKRYFFMQNLQDKIKPELDTYIKEKGEKEKQKSDEKSIKIKRWEPLINYLKSQTYSQFAQNIADDMSKGFPPIGRGGSIVQDMWSKQFGRRNSKDYDKAYEEFYDLFVKGDEKDWRWQ